MNIRRKGVSIALTATLLSSLLATFAAPAVFGAVSVTSAGTVPIGGTSTGTASFQFTENSAACFQDSGDIPAAPQAGNELTVTIFDQGDNPRVHFVGTPVVVAPGSLGATVTLSSTDTTNDTLNINFANSDDFNVEQITISGLQISADGPNPGPAAATGAIRAILTGNEVGCVLPGTATATGNLVQAITGAGAELNVDILLTGNCRFDVTDAGNSPSGQATFSAPSADPRNITDAGPGNTDTNGNGYTDSGDVQNDVDFAAGTTGHGAGIGVTQTVSIDNCSTLIASPGTVADAILLTASTRTFVLPGENNQPGGTATWTETGVNTFGTQTLTFTLAPAGVRFSAPPTVTGSATLDLDPGAGTAGTCALSIDRQSCTVTIVAGDAVDVDTITLSNVLLDVDATVPLGTPVTVALTTSGGSIIGGGVATIAFVARVIVAVAAQPTIFIGVNDQESGMITLSESLPGFFTGGTGANNTFGICTATGETLTRAPWAVVTAGNLQLLSGFVGSQSVKGTLFNGGSCAYWTVFSATTGTTPSVIEIRGSANDTTPLASGPNNGPRLSVPGGLAPGSTQIQVRVGQQPAVTGPVGASPAAIGLVSNAIRAFRAGPIVAAVSDPLCNPGDTDCLGGNITITEQFNGQLKAGQVITVRILPRATTQRQDVILKTGVTNDLPIVTTNSNSGLLVSPINVLCPPSALLGITLCQFTFVVTQQSFGPTLGQVTIGNIHYITAADAVNGPVLVNVTAPGAGAGGPAGSTSVDAVVSNAHIGPTPAPPVRTSLINGTLPGVVKVSEGRIFTASTKVVDVADYVTWQVDMDPAASGERAIVWIAKRSSSSTVWSAFTRFTTRAVNAQGLAVFHYDNGDVAGWVSVKWSFDGNSVHGPATSLARQARYV